jgi:hypothetical protein
MSGWICGGWGRRDEEHPMVTRALLIGGDAAGWLIPVRGGPVLAGVILVTMVAGFPQEIFDVPRDDLRWEQAKGRWLQYSRIENLPPDGFGRVGYWFMGREGQDGAELPLTAMQNFLALTEIRLATAAEEQRWPLVEATLNNIGHQLVTDGPEVDPPDAGSRWN